MKTTPKIVLASSSKRRRELVKALDAPVVVIPSTIEERPPRTSERAEDYVVETAAHKAQDVAGTVGTGSLVVGADTAVIFDGRILGKPSDADKARQMLVDLRGRSHQVATGVAVTRTGTQCMESSIRVSEVTMRSYSDIEIDAYVDSGEPFDKAGGYAIQDTLFAPVAQFDGCYLNVVGFPLCEVRSVLSALSVDVPFERGWRVPQKCPIDCPIRVASEVAA